MKAPLKLMPLEQLDKVVAEIAKLPKEAVAEPYGKKSRRTKKGLRRSRALD